MQMRYFIVYRPTLTLKDALLMQSSLVNLKKLFSEEYVPHIFNLREICLNAHLYNVHSSSWASPEIHHPCN